MNTKRRLLIDMDGTIVDLMGHLSTLTKLNHPVCQWDCSHCFEEGRNIYSRMSHQGVFVNAKPIEGAVEGVRQLMEHFDVWLVSTPVLFSDYGYSEKIQWVATHIPELIHRVVLTQDKTLIPAYALVDDKPGLTGPWEHIMYPATWNNSETPSWTTGLAATLIQDRT